MTCVDQIAWTEFIKFLFQQRLFSSKIQTKITMMIVMMMIITFWKCNIPVLLHIANIQLYSCRVLHVHNKCQYNAHKRKCWTTLYIHWEHLVYMSSSLLPLYTYSQEVMSWCLMSSDVIWHIRDKLWPMPKHGSIKSTYVRCMRV